VSAATQARIPRLLDPVECSAYDYASQKWITGPEARALRAKQLGETLSILESPKGREYLDMMMPRAIGEESLHRPNLHRAIAEYRAQIAELSKATGGAK
jgi:hypothetical protein